MSNRASSLDRQQEQREQQQQQQRDPRETTSLLASYSASARSNNDSANAGGAGAASQSSSSSSSNATSSASSFYSNEEVKDRTAIAKLNPVDKHSVRISASIIADALANTFSPDPPSITSSSSLKAYRLRSKYLTTPARFVTTLLCLLSFIEPLPYTINDGSDPDQIPTFGIEGYISARTSACIVSFSLTILVIDWFLYFAQLEYSISKFLGVGRNEKVNSNASLRCVYTLALVVYIAEIIYTRFSPINYVTPACRITLLIVFKRTAIRELALIVKLLPQIFDILALLLALVIFYAWFGVIVFSHKTEEGLQFFPSLLAGMWQLWILITTANFPNVMIPTYADHPLL
jgi:hypothetical protein